MSRYTSRHTGAKIDDAVDRATKYGLGPGSAPYVDDFNTARVTGWYSGTGDTTNGPDKIRYSSYGAVHVKRGGIIVHQDFFMYDADKFKGEMLATRASSDYGNTWTPWEYVNPPMQLGVEYRTTERYLGKPVYVKVVNCGAVPNNNVKNISLNASNIDVPLSETGYLARTKDTYKFSVPYLMTDTNKAITQGVSLYLRNDNNNTGTIVVQTQVAFSNEYNLYAIARYTKTTD